MAQVEAKLLVLLEPWQGTIDFKLQGELLGGCCLAGSVQGLTFGRPQGFSVEKDSAASILAVGRDPVLT